jgi:hypothetical protein
MSDLIVFIAFIANLVFLIWFGSTLNSVNGRIRQILISTTMAVAGVIAAIARDAVFPDRRDRFIPPTAIRFLLMFGTRESILLSKACWATSSAKDLAEQHPGAGYSRHE